MSKYGKFHDPCHASGQRYTSYASADRPGDENSMACPVCQKRVKLRALHPAARRQPARSFVVIPWHNRAAMSAQAGEANWTDVDADAARLALELECLLLDTKDNIAVSRWWASANEALELHRARVKASQEQAQQPSGGEVKAAPVESYPAQDQAFYAFWYSHMKGDLMQPPLADISHSTARYIWDSALATPKPEPMTDEQIANVVLQTVYAGDDSTPHRNAWAREIGIPFARAIEAHHGITKGSESAACSVCEGKGHVYRDGRCVGFCRCPAGRNALALNIPPAPITKEQA